MPREGVCAMFDDGTIIEGHTVYRHAGRGVPLLFLNGCGLSARSWHPVLNALPERTMIAVDRPGIGLTPWPGTVPTLRGEVDALAAIITAPCIVVAHSMAAFHAEGLARLYPELIAGIVLVDPSVEPCPRRWRTPIQTLSCLCTTALRVPLIRHAASSLLRRTTRHQAHHPNRLDDWAWREPYVSHDALAAGASEWLSYQRQASDLADLRTRYSIPPVPVAILTAPPSPDLCQLGCLNSAFGMFTHDHRVDSGHLMMVDCPDVISATIQTISH